jgi:ankyrin repeat protein
MNYMSVANEGIDRPPTPTKAALALAIKRGDVTTSRSILLAETIPFDINAQGMDGGTLLMLAAEGGNAGVCGLLLQRGADVNILDSDGCSALWGAASYGHAGVCELLCRYGALVNAPCGPTDTPPLLEATFGGHLDACEILLQHGALVNLAGRNNVTPLTLAAEMGHVTVCELLLRYGADVNGCGLKLLPPLALISGMACYDSNNLIPTYSGNCVLSTLIQPTDMDGTYDLFQGSTNNITDAIVYRDVSTPASPFDASLGMTMRPPSISVASPAGGKAYRDGSSPLLLAASNGHLQCCQVLLKYGADVNRMNKVLHLWYSIFNAVDDAHSADSLFTFSDCIRRSIAPV